ncbi:hypothetical protein [Draconibacterium sp.]|uniref:hypothetical protein n=1 Tax=Draconibacterium sp. TaxID=1965318 RepID=UPI003568EBD1
MKARKLKEILNNTDYSIGDHGEYIAVGSPLCHDLFSVNKKTLKIKYALDTWNKGRKALEREGYEEGLFIWDKLHELVESGEIKEIIEGHDELKVKLPVFYCEDGKLIESHTDKYGWPNTTFDGITMYDNTHFKTREEALKQGISETGAWIKLLEEQIDEKEQELYKKRQSLLKRIDEQGYFESLLK